MDVHNPILDQMVLEKFIRERKIDRHINHMRHIYAHKRKVLLEALAQNFGAEILAWGDASGLHIALEFKHYIFNSNFVVLCKENELRINLVSTYCKNSSKHNNKLLLGYGHLSISQIQEGVTVLSHFIKSNSMLVRP